MELREKLKTGKRFNGVFSMLGSCVAAECLALAGFDYIVIDTEHGPFSEESTLDLVRSVQQRSRKAFIRVKDSSRSSLTRALDIGADALIVPDVHSVDEVKKIIQYTKYYPLGRRGFGFSRSNGYGTDSGLTDLANYFNKTNEEKWIIPQCETAGALKDIYEIASLAGVNGIFVGPYDLSIALGAPARFDTDTFQQGIHDVLKACKENGKLSMIYAGTPDQANEYYEMGFDAVAIGTDISFLTKKCEEILKSL